MVAVTLFSCSGRAFFWGTLNGLLRWERKSHIVDCIWVSCLRADWWLYSKGVFCLKCRIMWKKNVASQRHIVWDSRYLDGSPVFSMAVSKSEDSLIQTELRKKLMLDSHCWFTEVLADQDRRNLAEHPHRRLDNWGSYKPRLWSRWNDGVTNVGLGK